jgi:two-component system NtrC family sensor kinase
MANTVPTISDAPPSKTLATRILLSFAVTLVAFAVTLGFTAFSQKRAAEDSEELAKGFVPVALKLGQLRAVQSTFAAIVDGIPDEKNPRFTRDILKTLDGERHLIFEQTRNVLRADLRELGSDETRQLALSLTGDLDGAAASWGDDRQARERVFSEIERGDKEAFERELSVLRTMEATANKRLRALAARVDTSMRSLSAAARARERRAIVELALLALLTLGVGAAVAIHTRRLLGPLERVTQRAKAVARGDLTPQATERTDDEIGELATAFERMVGAVAKAQSRAVANERLAAIGKMAAHVTHEIRNPLSSIGLNIELLEENLVEAGIGGESRALLSAIRREVDRLEHLSEEYLRVARLPSPRMEADDLGGKIRDIVAFAKPEMDRAAIALSLTIDAPLPPALFDEGQIRQAVLNVLRNAREAMSDGGTIAVDVRAEGMSLVVRIDDEGSGIPDEVRARIFDPFFSTKGEGTGLGLAITRQIIEAHGGSVAVEARPSGGTSFRLLVPISPHRASTAPLRIEHASEAGHA